MATLALSVAGQFAGALVGGPIGATIGRALGALAGSAIDSAIFGEEPSAATPSDIRLQGSTEGGVIPRLYGWNRIAGNIIWATSLERQSVQTSGAKGMQSGTNEEIIANFAVGLCEGEVARLGRIWADGRPLEMEGLNIRFYKGDRTQMSDTLIEAKQGVGNAPAYRGLCYLVFEALPLGQFGNRIPNITVELCRPVGDLEPAIRAITIIPGATEFGYDPTPRVRIVSPGVSASENTHLLGQTSDWTLSIDELLDLCPNLEHVALVVAWFGNDLRAGKCLVQPRVEAATREISGVNWIVSGNSRAQVPTVSQYQGGPAYGGTPSDGAVLAAIADLKARGLKVTLYPFIMMDIAQANSLTDPYTGTSSQPSYPWRGRITCDPAPGQPGSPDKSATILTQIDSFCGSAAVADFVAGTQTVNYSGPVDWGYRRMILHYAKLATMAGGIDAILIGSELRGLTWLRQSDTGFPFVDRLVTLAADVRLIVGAATKITYAADWSEYSGLQPPEAPGDKLFHLDPLWASPNINAIGIDNYMPVSDWRDAEVEPDALSASHIHQLSYLKGNIAGGEGYDWYYASDADRKAATRTPISDNAYGESWVWRFKDLKSWWSNAHYNRVGGVRASASTAFIPEAKPIWFTELGCAAIDKGPNGPNNFGDPKSSENALPPFSNGSPDALVQRQFLRAHHQYWQPGSLGFVDANNPASSKYGGRMLDTSRLYVWTWDARPFPAFPMQSQTWADGTNYATGHWLSGRFGASASDELAAKMAGDFQMVLGQISAAAPLVQGALVANIVSLRRAIEPLLNASGLLVRDTTDGIKLVNPKEVDKISVLFNSVAATDGSLTSRKSPNHDEAIGSLTLTYLDRNKDYQSTTIAAVADLNPVQTGVTTNLVLNGDSAFRAAANILDQYQLCDGLEFDLPLSFQALEVGDLIDLQGQKDGPFRITNIRAGEVLKISARVQYPKQSLSFIADQTSSLAAAPLVSSAPVIIAAQLPGDGGDREATRLVIGAFAQPWPGEVAINDDISGAGIARLTSSAMIGELTKTLLPASASLWDRANQIELTLYGGHLSSATELETLNGANRIAVLCDDGSWEVIGFAQAQLISPNTYRLTSLLRGLNTSSPPAPAQGSIGAPVLVLSSFLASVAVKNDQLDTSIALRAYAGSSDLVGQSVTAQLSSSPAIALAPAHLKASIIAGSSDISIGWIRRSRVGGDDWSGVEVPLDFAPESYLVTILNGTNLVRQITTTMVEVTYSAADQIADFGIALSAFDFLVQQVSPVYGAGHSASATFST